MLLAAQAVNRMYWLNVPAPVGDEIGYCSDGVELRKQGAPYMIPPHVWRDMVLLHPKSIIATGCSHTVFLGSDGKVFAFGRGAQGQLGLFTRANHATPQYFGWLPGVQFQDIAVGDYHTVLVSVEGNVFTCGRGAEGQLGLGAIDDQDRLQRVAGLPPIKRVAAGSCRTFFLTADGDVFTCGNGYGGLGLDAAANQHKPQQVIGLPPIKQVALGISHLVFVAVDGKVYTCGEGVHGKLGLGTTDDHVIPQLVTGLPLIERAAAGRSHTVLVSKDGQVFTCGLNGEGQLGLGGETNQDKPQLVKGLPAHIIDAAVGDNHTVLLTVDGRAYTVGRGLEGQLGLGRDINDGRYMQHWFHVPHYNMPQCVTALDGIAIEAVAARGSHSVYLAEDGRVFMCGQNIFSGLGFGQLSCPIPKPVQEYLREPPSVSNFWRLLLR
jgi:alpha-tubulin suppressor-like RCC1 family protein